MFTYRLNLPLLQAYMYENLRYKTVSPILIPHKAIRVTELTGFKVKDQKLLKNVNDNYIRFFSHVYATQVLI